MKSRTNNNKIGKNEYIPYQSFLKHVRTLSNKSNKPSNKKRNSSRPIFQKLLTQVPKSHQKRTQNVSPTKSRRSKSRKSKLQNKIEPNKLANLSVTKSRQTKQNSGVIQSLTIAHADISSQEDLIRNNSQFSTKKNVVHQILTCNPLLGIFKKTQRTLQKYEESIQSLRKKKLQATKELASAKKRIFQLQWELLKQKSYQI